MSMKIGDLVGVPHGDGTVGCPIRRVVEVIDGSFKMEVPGIGTSRAYTDDGTWVRVGGTTLAEAADCGCFRCTSPLTELAFCAD